jgi:proteasome lid subunit RPN8/RPN11
LSTPFQLQVPRCIHAQLLAQAQAELPNECCGLLAGRVGQEGGRSVARVSQCYPLINAAERPTIRYESEPRSMFAAVRDIERQGLEVLAVYHSHPTSDPIPSRTDRERNYSPDVVNLIISLHSAEPCIRAWWLTEVDYREADWLVVPDECR